MKTIEQRYEIEHCLFDGIKKEYVHSFLEDSLGKYLCYFNGSCKRQKRVKEDIYCLGMECKYSKKRA